jgi:DNA end-binding protein Ku
MPEPHDMVDRYQAALRELVEAKVTGRQLEQPPALASAGQGESLMEALRRSVEQAKQDRADTRPAPRKRPAKPAAPRQSSPGNKAAKNSPAKRTPAEKNAKR